MEAKFYDSMEEAENSERRNADGMRISIAKYKDKFIVTGEERNCEGCDEGAFCRFFDGMWFCPECIVETLNEDPDVSGDGFWKWIAMSYDPMPPPKE